MITQLLTSQCLHTYRNPLARYKHSKGFSLSEPTTNPPDVENTGGQLHSLFTKTESIRVGECTTVYFTSYSRGNTFTFKQS